jgi:hypothetical protein
MAPAKRPHTPRRKAKIAKARTTAQVQAVTEVPEAENGRDPASMGRPPIEFKEEDWKEFEQLCGFRCTLGEVASWFSVSEDTIERRVKEHYDGRTFAEVFKEKSLSGLASLRRAQFASAIGGNATMQIWLGKQLLGQKDKTEISGNPEAPLGIEHSGEVHHTTRMELTVVQLPPNGWEPGGVNYADDPPVPEPKPKGKKR